MGRIFFIWVIGFGLVVSPVGCKLSFGSASQAWGSQTPDHVWLDIQDADTAFMIAPSAHKAWWVVDKCRRELPLQNGPSAQMKFTSKMISKNVILGSRHIKLEQQFRFSLATSPISVEVYNSVRGGWSPVPVSQNKTCRLEGDCSARMELPEC